MLTPFHLFVVAALFAGAGPDRVKLVEKDKELEGRVVHEGADEIVLRVNKRDQRIARKDIAEIHSLERSLNPIIERDLHAADATALAALAKEAEGAGLEHDARNLWLRVLLTTPSNDDAVKSLAAQRIMDDVKIPFGKEKRMLGELGARQKSWKEHYELESTHFVLRSDLELAFALDLSLALERNYRRFYDTLGTPLELYVFDDRVDAPEVEVYSHAADFPIAPVKGDPIWFAPGANQLHVLAETEPNVRAVVHELTKMMLFNALRRASGSTGQVPMWTAIGVSELFAIAAPPKRFGEWSEIGAPDAASFQAAKSGAISFEKVFNASANDFGADPKSAQMIPSAYSLVHFLVFSDGGKLRAGYGKFLREGAKGKISVPALTAAIGMDAKALEAAWRAYVDANAK